jgi:hypothetical protein
MLKKRCLVQMSIVLPDRPGNPMVVEHLQKDMEVDMERELYPGFTVADAVAGREACFEDIAADEKD